MLDFTTALYLGFDHPSRDLEPWDRLTIGVPAAVEPVPGAGEIEHGLAAVVGKPAALVGRSTLHLLVDVIASIGPRHSGVYIDGAAYPIVDLAVRSMVGRAGPVRRFRHHDAPHLATIQRGPRPIVICDGVCPKCGRTAPLRSYLSVVERTGGTLLIDDTQALGVLGASPDSCDPYGRGGGGSTRFCGIESDRVVVVASLAKGFGVPMAVVCASPLLVSRIRHRGILRVHGSQPSMADVAAAKHALRLNARAGDSRRRSLHRAVSRFQAELDRHRISPPTSRFPVQLLTIDQPGLVMESLTSAGIRAILTGDHRGRPRLTFILTAQHTDHAIRHAVASVAIALGRGGNRSSHAGSIVS